MSRRLLSLLQRPGRRLGLAAGLVLAAFTLRWLARAPSASLEAAPSNPTNAAQEDPTSCPPRSLPDAGVCVPAPDPEAARAAEETAPLGPQGASLYPNP